MATTLEFEAAAREWTQLLRAPEALALALRRADALLKLAVAVALAQVRSSALRRAA